MNEEAAKKVVALLIDSLESEAKKLLPSYVRDSWLSAFSDMLSKGLYHLWVNVITNVVHIEANTVEIIDERPRLSESSLKKDD